MIVVINGLSGIGKDTFIDYAEKCFDVTNVSSVDVVKEAAAILGWDGGKGDKDRNFLGALKELSDSYCDSSYDYICDKIRCFNQRKRKDSIMFIHIREPKNIKRVVKEFNAKTLLLTPHRQDPLVVCTNRYDRGVYDYPYDYVLTLGMLPEDSDELVCDFILGLGVEKSPEVKPVGFYENPKNTKG